MKTKIITITALIAAALLVPMAVAQETRPGGWGPQRIEAPRPEAQGRQFAQQMTPEQRARVREFVQDRLWQQQRRPAFAQGQRQDFGPPTVADRAPGRGQGVAPQGRPFAQGRPDFRGPGQGRMQTPAPGQGRIERPFMGRGQQQCPCCNRPMPQAAPQRQQQFDRPLQRPDAPMGFRGQQFERPFRGQDGQRPERDQFERPDAPQDGQGFQRGQGRGFGPDMPQFDPDDDTSPQVRPRQRRNAQ